MLKVQLSSNNLSWDNFSLSFDAITPFLFSLLVFFLQLIGIEVKTHNKIQFLEEEKKNIFIAIGEPPFEKHNSGATQRSE